MIEINCSGDGEGPFSVKLKVNRSGVRCLDESRILLPHFTLHSYFTLLESIGQGQGLVGWLEI